MTATQVLTIDQNTGRQITWTIKAMSDPEQHPNTCRRAAEQGYTHHAYLSKARGRCVYAALVEIDPGTGQVLRSSEPWKVW